ncbi:MAG: hypothetical protein V4812_07525 [Pseudomonadota bacterium]
MQKQALLWIFCAALAGCAGGSRLCEVITPPPASGPTEQDNQRIERQSTGDATQTGNEDQAC